MLRSCFSLSESSDTLSDCRGGIECVDPDMYFAPKMILTVQVQELTTLTSKEVLG